MRSQKERTLARDLDLLESGWVPDERVLASAPLLDQWAFAQWGGAITLVGLSSGHPELAGDRRLITTSSVFAVAVDRSWARTYSRWYRLGAPRDRA